MPKNEARLNRINEELKKELSQVLNYELKNPNVTGMLSVTKVKITPGQNKDEKPNGVFESEDIIIHEGWLDQNTRWNYDIAIIKVKPNKNNQHIGDVVPPVSMETKDSNKK